MLQPWVVVAVSAGYLALLFAVAYYGDRRADTGRSLINNATVYALSLAVYATSWTYYGSVGRAASEGVGFLPIYLGPMIMVAMWWVLLRKIIRISRRNRITSLADFVSARYGKSSALGGLVTIIAVVGILPYIALQLKAVSNTFGVLQGYPDITVPTPVDDVPFLQDTGLYVALVMAAFTILFGTRHLDATERHEGMVAAIAFESVVKLVAFLVVGFFVTFGMFGGFGELFSLAAADEGPGGIAELFTLAPEEGYGGWVWLVVLSMFAIVLLPRQWQIGVVENVDERHLVRASWLFPLYLLAINIFVLPITIAGLLTFDGDVDADTYVLALPMAQGQQALALLAFIGGLSAATGMIIVETIALSTMVSNSLILPALLRRGVVRRHDLSRMIFAIRRVAIVLILFLGYAYFRAAGEAIALVTIGLMSFAAVAQFAPALFGGLLWKGGTRDGAIAGLLGGFGMWAYTLLLPTFAESGWLAASFVTEGPFGIGLLRPRELFGLTGMDAIGHGVFWSMLVNVGLYVAVSLARKPGPVEHAQAVLFTDASAEPSGVRLRQGSAFTSELRGLLERFLGAGGAREAMDHYVQASGREIPEEADPELVHHVETVLAGAVGTASARILVESVIAEEPVGLGGVMEILDEASQVRAYSRSLEQKSRELEEATAELREANERLTELDSLKDDFVSTVSHELRTPLTSIRAFSEILLDNSELDTEQRERFLRVIVEETARLTRLINQILDLSKLESGRVEWTISEVDLGSLVRDSVAATAQLFEQYGAGLDVRLPEAVPPVRADSDRIVQVLVNLLANAAKFTSGQAGVELNVLDSEIRVDVADDGPGIDPTDTEAIFEKFRQGAGTGDERPSGTGLGLPISRQIVEYLGGSLWVENGPSRGATFSLTLPLIQERS